MAKKKSAAREYVWLQCTECDDLNYRTSVNVKGGLPEKMKEGIRKYSRVSANTRCTRSSGKRDWAPCTRHSGSLELVPDARCLMTRGEATERQ